MAINKELISILTADSLPTHDFIFELAEKFSDILENEITDYRVPSEIENGGVNAPGSLLDFQEKPLPTLIVPDLHARPDFLLNILKYKPFQTSTVWDLLKKKAINVICVGDALHSEKSSRTRWMYAENEYRSGDFTGPNMTSEMVKGLALLCGVMKLKTLFPENFHFLKGNHENILNKTGDGDYSFRKYADEGEMVMMFMRQYYGDDVLYLLHCAEDAMPLVAVAKGCVISHAEPKTAYTKQQIVNARKDSSVVEGLTWTDNNSAADGSVASIIRELALDGTGSNYVYFGGHRPVEANYRLRQGGLFIQIHNPLRQNVAIVKIDKKFNPDEDICEVKNE